MKTTATLLRALSLSLLLGTASVYADISLDSDAQVAGTWRLEHTKKNAESNKTTERSDTWIIGNGKLIMKGIKPLVGDVYDSQPTDYTIEDGKLKVSLGRVGKYDSYTLISRTDDSMVLKDKMGVMHYFKKKK
jgi:hypothetical protein